MNSNSQQLLPTNNSAAREALCAAWEEMQDHEIRALFVRLTGSHFSAVILHEIIGSFMPRTRGNYFSRADIYRNGKFWMARNQKEWWERNGITRTHLESAYKRCAEFLEVCHFMLNSQRTTHYHIDYDRVLLLLESDRNSRKAQTR